MKRYNYFDDEPEHEAQKQALSAEGVKNTISTAVSRIFSFARAVGNEPGKKKLFIRLAAVVLFIIIVLIAVFSFAHSLNSRTRTQEQFNKDAGRVCAEYITLYGASRWESLDESRYGENKARLTGLCYARQMDFDGDSSDELMLCYYSKNVYYLDVWGYSSGEFKKLYSEEANSTGRETDGYWVGFCHSKSKYYICKSEKDNPTEVTLYALKKDGFKPTSSKYDYDYENDIYAKNGRINSTDFETVRLSVFRKSKGDIIIDTVTKNLDAFGSVTVTQGQDGKTEKQKMYEAYYALVSKRIERYGPPGIVTQDEVSYIDGVAFSRFIDFDGDGCDELFVAYRKPKTKSKYDYGTGGYINYEVPSYSAEVYSWNGSTANRILTKDSVSCFIEEENIFFLIFQKGESSTAFCNNTFTAENNYSYTASSKIYKLRNGKFQTTYSAKIVNDYGYKQFYLDNERVYQSEFEQRGYKVPFFMNSEDSFDENKYEIVYLSGRGEDTFEATVTQTQKTLSLLKNSE